MVKLNELVECLCDADIDFVMVAGIVDMLHGSARVIRDLDVHGIEFGECHEVARNIS